MIKKVLVANRSEIACRIFQTCREMGLQTVGIYVSGDESARHLTYADEVKKVLSYLDASSIILAAKESNADLIHPGYGFLSERSSFARAVEAAGLIFVGPRAATMDAMGDKIASKEFALSHKIPTLPWARVFQGQDLNLVAQEIGFPLLMKASAGGGGKGMRLVCSSKELFDCAQSASAESLAAFGDGSLFLEKWIDKPRHIEVQVFGDGMGGGIHLYERECSLQRRHQKIWEESPAFHLSQSIRNVIFNDALKLVRATHYLGAGTVEFILDEEGNSYFLEMNTRLQVEHPVTELVTGIDLVWAQLAQALGDVKILKESPDIRGHAIEVRLCAEDPAQGFIPQIGKINRLRWPMGNGIRVESGIEEGQEIGTQFDSMLGKIIVHASNRQKALAKLKFALEETVILGVGTNQSYLKSLINHPQVIEGSFHTQFLENEFKNFSFYPNPEELEILMAARLSLVGKTPNKNKEDSDPSPWFAFNSKRIEKS